MPLPTDRTRFDILVAKLDDADRSRFLQELLDAQWRAQAQNDYRPVCQVIEAWQVNVAWAGGTDVAAAEDVDGARPVSYEELVSELEARFGS